MAEGETGPARTAQPPVDAAPATQSDHDSAAERQNAPVNEAAAAGPDGAGQSRVAGSAGPGAARADEVAGPSHSTDQATGPGDGAAAPPAHDPGAAPGAAGPAEGPKARPPHENAETTGDADVSSGDAGEGLTGQVVGEGLTGQVVEAPPGSTVAGRDPSGSAVDVPRWAPAAPAPEPSWGKVLGTTISLWTRRRLQRLTGRGRPGGPAGDGPAAITGAPARRGGLRWPLVAFVLLLVILALVGLQLSGALSQRGPGQAAPRSNGGGTGSGTGSNSALSAAQAARARAATWVAQQVTSSAQIACDPLMCSALSSDGVAASRLVTIEPTTPDPLGAEVVVATSSVRSQFGSALVSEYAPQLIASFGTGTSRVDVRAVASDGAAAFNSSEAADRAQRQQAGKQLIRTDSLIGEKDAAAIRAGQVDSRVLITLASLLSQRAVDVGSFEDTAPGAPILYREVTIVDAPGQTGSATLQTDLSQVRTQPSAYRPAHAQIVQLANGQSALRIAFGAPDPPGLLSGGGNS